MVVGGWWLCEPILAFYFGPDQAFGLRHRLGPSRTIVDIVTITMKHVDWLCELSRSQGVTPGLLARVV